MINARLRAIDSDIDVQLLQARNAGLDFVAETLPVIGKNQVIKRSILRTARQHGATGRVGAFAALPARSSFQCNPVLALPTTVPGIGPIISSAMVAAIGTGDVF